MLSRGQKQGKVEFKMSYRLYMFGEGPWPLSEDTVVKISGQTPENSVFCGHGSAITVSCFQRDQHPTRLRGLYHLVGLMFPMPPLGGHAPRVMSPKGVEFERACRGIKTSEPGGEQKKKTALVVTKDGL